MGIDVDVKRWHSFFFFSPLSRFPRASSSPLAHAESALFPTWRRWPSSTRCLFAARVASMLPRREREKGGEKSKKREVQSR